MISRELTDTISRLLLSDKLDEAELLILPLVEDHPNVWISWHKLGGLRSKRGDWAMAIDAYKKALELSPYEETSWYGLANAYWNNNEYAFSLQAYKQLIAISPQHAEALMMAGECNHQLGRFWDAYQYFKRYMEIHPHRKEAMIGKIIVCLENAERERTDDVMVKIALWWHLVEVGHKSHAEEIRYRAIYCDPRTFCLFYPNDSVGLGVKIAFNMKICNWEGWREDVNHLRSLIRGGEGCDPVFNSLGTTQEEQMMNTGTFTNWKYSDRKIFDITRKIHRKNGKITLGYISSDFHEHATAHLITGLFERHDRSQFNVVAFSCGRNDDSPERKRLMESVDMMYDISKLSIEDAVKLIEKEQVDILIDLKGWCQGHCMDVLTQRPAPILVHYLGWPGTTIVCDYIIADHTVIPEENRQYFTEKVAYLPGCYQINDPLFEVTSDKTRKDYGLPEDAYVYACFNQAYKITPEAWDHWMNKLRTKENSVLWLLWMNQEQTENLKYEAHKAGIKPERLIPMDFVSRREHLARMLLADEALETFPVTGHTTMSDCVRMGVKVDFYPETENTFIGLVGKSIWDNKDILFDTDAKTTQIEDLYKRMVDRHEQGLYPDHLL